MWDERISWIGSVLLMTLFAGYFTLLFLNNSVVKASEKIHGFFKKTTKAVVTEAGIYNNNSLIIINIKNACLLIVLFRKNCLFYFYIFFRLEKKKLGNITALFYD